MKYRLSLQRKRDADYVHTDTKITPAGIPRASPKFRALEIQSSMPSSWKGELTTFLTPRSSSNVGTSTLPPVDSGAT